jgi:DnaJ-class molecular chaperone
MFKMTKYETCPVCKGKGYIEVKGRDVYSAPECGTCKGTGKVEKK